MKCGAAWATLDGVLSKLWVTDAQKNFGLKFGDNYITKWKKKNYVYVPVPGFPADGLTSKVLFDRIREVTVLTGIITDK